MAAQRILVIDDDPTVLRMLFQWFTSANYECVTAADGAHGVSMALHKSPDGIVCDLRLPDMTGFEVVAAIRADVRTSTVPVWVITGESRGTDLLAGAARGLKIQGYFQKPFSLDKLLEAVAAVLGKNPQTSDSSPIIERGPLRIDVGRREVTVNGQPLKLGPRRFELLCALAKSRDGVTGNMLRAFVWGEPDKQLNTLAKTVNRLRRDLEQASGKDMIVQIPGGYRLQ